MVESSLGILGACLPTYRPLFTGISLESVVASVRSMLSLQTLSSRASGSRSQRIRSDPDGASQNSNVGLNPENNTQQTDGLRYVEIGDSIVLCVGRANASKQRVNIHR